MGDIVFVFCYDYLSFYPSSCSRFFSQLDDQTRLFGVSSCDEILREI